MLPLFEEVAFAVATIWQEARGESYAGKLAVAEVIRNRMQRRYSSDGTILGTVLRPYQFSGWNTTDPNRLPALRLQADDPIVQECKRAWNEAVLEGTRTVEDAVLYYNPAGVDSGAPKWAMPVNQVARVGAHVFFRA